MHHDQLEPRIAILARVDHCLKTPAHPQPSSVVGSGVQINLYPQPLAVYKSARPRSRLRYTNQLDPTSLGHLYSRGQSGHTPVVTPRAWGTPYPGPAPVHPWTDPMVHPSPVKMETLHRISVGGAGSLRGPRRKLLYKNIMCKCNNCGRGRAKVGWVGLKSYEIIVQHNVSLIFCSMSESHIFIFVPNKLNLVTSVIVHHIFIEQLEHTWPFWLKLFINLKARPPTTFRSRLRDTS